MNTPTPPQTQFATLTTLGTITIEPLQVHRDAELIHQWLSDPASAFWQMTNLSTTEVHEYFTQITADPHQAAWLGQVDGQPTFLIETYDPNHVLLTHITTIRPGDYGMHLLVAPPHGQRTPGLTTQIMQAVARFIFDALTAVRVIVEPDRLNTLIAAKNEHIGFRTIDEINLPGKRATLSVLTRHDFRAAHLTPEPMAAAHRALVAKALAEFSHERLLAPVGIAPGGRFVVEVAEGDVVYEFSATQYALEHWAIAPESIERRIGGEQASLDALQFIVECQSVLGIPDHLLATYLEEVASTLASSAFKRHRGSPSAARLVNADFQTLEAAMTEGHPAFVANNGRIGFDLDDFHDFTPETAAPIRLVWLAARREHAHLSLGQGLSEHDLYTEELGEQTIERFAHTLRGHGLDPGDYRYLPLHPWQWRHRAAITFAPDLARRALVYLGEGEDVYQAQQSIRTLFNRSRPSRHYVKTALAIQNMGFLRGLSPAYMRHTPAINDWVYNLVAGDPTLREAGFEILRERAGIGWTGDAYHRSTTCTTHHKMLAALWRESPTQRVSNTQNLSTMAALLHRDHAGRGLASELIIASGRPADEWVRSYLHAYLRPIVHCLRAHDLVFMPHSENVILVLENSVPVRILMKDIGEEIALFTTRSVPEPVAQRVQVVSDAERALSIFADVFDGVLRFLAAILDQDGMLPERAFWELVAECVDRHADEHPALRSSVDLRTATFDHSCLNRLQLRNTLQMVDLANQAESLIFAGTLPNPIARP